MYHELYYNVHSETGSGIYELKQDLLSLKKEKYSTLLTVKEKIKQLKFEHRQLESHCIVEKYGTPLYIHSTVVSWVSAHGRSTITC